MTLGSFQNLGFEVQGVPSEFGLQAAFRTPNVNRMNNLSRRQCWWQCAAEPKWQGHKDHLCHWLMAADRSPGWQVGAPAIGASGELPQQGKVQKQIVWRSIVQAVQP